MTATAPHAPAGSVPPPLILAPASACCRPARSSSEVAPSRSPPDRPATARPKDNRRRRSFIQCVSSKVSSNSSRITLPHRPRSSHARTHARRHQARAAARVAIPAIASTLVPISEAGVRLCASREREVAGYPGGGARLLQYMYAAVSETSETSLCESQCDSNCWP